MLWKCCTKYASKFGKLSSDHRTVTINFYSNPKERQCQRMLKLPQNYTHLTRYKVVLKILQARFQQYVNIELRDVQDGFRKGRRTRDQISNICWIIKKAREFQKKKIYISISVLFTMPKRLTVCVTINCGKFGKRWEYQTTWSISWETYMQVRKQELELDI